MNHGFARKSYKILPLKARKHLALPYLTSCAMAVILSVFGWRHHHGRLFPKSDRCNRIVLNAVQLLNRVNYSCEVVDGRSEVIC